MLKIITILICDDHPIVRIGLRSLIAENPDMQLVGEVSDGEDYAPQRWSYGNC